MEEKHQTSQQFGANDMSEKKELRTLINILESVLNGTNNTFSKKIEHREKYGHDHVFVWCLLKKLMEIGFDCYPEHTKTKYLSYEKKPKDAIQETGRTDWVLVYNSTEVLLEIETSKEYKKIDHVKDQITKYRYMFTQHENDIPDGIMLIVLYNSEEDSKKYDYWNAMTELFNFCKAQPHLRNSSFFFSYVSYCLKECTFRHDYLLTPSLVH